MIYDPEKGDLKSFGDIKEDIMDSTTKQIYNSQVFTYNFVKHRIPEMPPAIKKHFEDIGVFIEGVEAGVIKHWQDFYKTAKEMKGRGPCLKS